MNFPTMLDYVLHRSNFKRKVLALKAIPDKFFMFLSCSHAKICAPLKLNTSRVKPGLPECCRLCLTPAPGDILFPPSPWVLSISLVAPPGWWQHSSISFCWCLLLHTLCLAWALSLWCQDQNYSLWTHPVPSVYLQLVPFSGSSGSVYLQHKGTSWQLGFSVLLLSIPLLLWADNYNSKREFHSTLHCMESWSPMLCGIQLCRALHTPASRVMITSAWWCTIKKAFPSLSIVRLNDGKIGHCLHPSILNSAHLTQRKLLEVSERDGWVVLCGKGLRTPWRNYHMHSAREIQQSHEHKD